MTTTQRQRKITNAAKRLNEALALLDEVGADMRDTPGHTSQADSAMWRSVVDAASDTERARNALQEWVTH